MLKSTTPTITAARLADIEKYSFVGTKGDLIELCRLARLGLEMTDVSSFMQISALAKWAQEHAVPALRHYADIQMWNADRAVKALAALPAAEQKGDE